MSSITFNQDVILMLEKAYKFRRHEEGVILGADAIR
jgi:hypothetical protein